MNSKITIRDILYVTVAAIFVLCIGALYIFGLTKVYGLLRDECISVRVYGMAMEIVFDIVLAIKIVHACEYSSIDDEAIVIAVGLMAYIAGILLSVICMFNLVTIILLTAINACLILALFHDFAPICYSRDNEKDWGYNL